MALSFAAISYWAVQNPFPVYQDNALYLNDCRRDLHALRSGGFAGLGRSLLYTNPFRPPGYRLLALAATPLAGADIGVLRVVSLLAWAAALWVVYCGVRSVAGEAAGLLSVMLLAVSPTMTSAVRVFGSESALYLAVAATLSILLRGMACPKPSPRIWISLGLALGLGLLAKLSFPWVVGGPVAWCLLLAWRRRLPGLTAAHLLMASGLGLVIAVPWYAVNLRSALAMALLSKNGGARYSLGDSSWGVFAVWLGEIRSTGLGSQATLSCALLILAVVISRTRRLSPQPPPRPAAIRTALLACVLGVLPFAAGQFLASSNHDLRILSPVFFPLLAGVAITTASAPWLSRSPAALCIAVLLMWQVHAKIFFWATSRSDYWDWAPLHGLISSQGLVSPQMVFMGSAIQYNQDHLAAPWVERDQRVKIEALWRPEHGRIRWPRVLERVGLADAVLVPPSFKGDPQSPIKLEDLDNSHNARLAQLLSEDPRFSPPQVVRVGRDQIPFFVFFRVKPTE